MNLFFAFSVSVLYFFLSFFSSDLNLEIIILTRSDQVRDTTNLELFRNIEIDTNTDQPTATTIHGESDMSINQEILI